MTRRWQPACRCRCGAALSAPWVCVECGRTFVAADGVLRWCTAEQRAAWQGFLDQYRHVREADGYRRVGADYYRALPLVSRDDPEWSVWQVRRQSFACLRQMLGARYPAAARVLDLGAGCAWLSARLGDLGYLTVAVDVLEDVADGLGAITHYAQPPFAVAADFTDMPFEAGQFDVVVFNGSLHYSPTPSAALAAAATQLRPGGLLVVMDSPMFVRDDDGRQMRVRRRRFFHSVYGIETPIEPGCGYLTFGELAEAAERLDRCVTFLPSRGTARWEAGRRWRRWTRRVIEPSFGVWVAA